MTNEKTEEKTNEPETKIVVVNDVVPKFEISVEENKRRIDQVKKFVQEQMVEGQDFGKIPGIDRPTLLKPGAEKLCNIFGFGVEVEEVSKVEDWDKPLFSYTFKAKIINKRTGLAEAECVGNCNSKESKYAYRWQPDFKITDEEKSRADRSESRKAKSGKSFVWFRIPNDDIYSQINTLQKMAQKRAIVGAVLIATRASGYMTQDVEDSEPEVVVLDDYPTPPPPAPPRAATPQPAAKPATATAGEIQPKSGVKCEVCGIDLTDSVRNFSEKMYKKPLCFNHQKEYAPLKG